MAEKNADGQGATLDSQLRKFIYDAVGGELKELGDDWNIDDVGLEHPKVEEHGDYSSNIAMTVFSKKQESGNKQHNSGRWQSPRDLADVIVERLENNKDFNQIFEKPEVAAIGFINFKLKNSYLVSQLHEVIRHSNKYGSATIGEGKTVVVEYSSPNIAKPFGIGHLRSTIIGQALYNLYCYLGYKVVGDNHLGDWGTQFGKLLYMLETKGDKDLDLKKLEEYYIEFHKLAEDDNTLEGEAREWFKKLEEGDNRARDLWRRCVEISQAEFQRIYELLDVKIDNAYGESSYEDQMVGVIKDAKEKGIVYESEGALVIEVPGIKTPLMLLKSDGATTYATRDLATVKFRQEKWHPTKMIYEVGIEQALHFQQIFGAAKLLGYVDENTEMVHTKHGLYLDTNGKKFATREGRTVKLEEVLSEAVERAKKFGGEADPREVGIGAIKYFDLNHNIQSDIVFDWEKVMALDGNSGPYLQYTYARTQSVLQKATRNMNQETSSNKKPDIGSLVLNEEELRVMRWLYRFPEVVMQAANEYAPHLVCQYLFESAQRFNTFYNKHSILGVGEKEPDENARSLRLAMTTAVGQVIRNGLEILGIKAPEKM